MNDVKDASFSQHNAEARSLLTARVVKPLLLVLTLLYLLGTVSALIVLSETVKNKPIMRRLFKTDAEQQLTSTLVRSCLQHAFITSACATALVLIARRSTLAYLAAGFAASVTGIVAVTALSSSIATGFHAYHLVEPLIVFPCVASILWTLTRHSCHD